MIKKINAVRLHLVDYAWWSTVLNVRDPGKKRQFVMLTHILRAGAQDCVLHTTAENGIYIFSVVCSAMHLKNQGPWL